MLKEILSLDLVNVSQNTDTPTTNHQRKSRYFSKFSSFGL